jgi:hypothetical protein
MQEIPNVVTFQAPHYLGEDISNSAGLLEAEAPLSQFLAAQLSNGGLVVGQAIEERKVRCISRKVEVGGKRFWINVSYDRSLNQWTLLIIPNGIIWRTLLRRILPLPWTDAVQMERLHQLVDQSLKSDERIANIEWRTLGERLG